MFEPFLEQRWTLCLGSQEAELTMDQQLLHNVLHYVLLQALWGRVLAAPLPDQGSPGACRLALDIATSNTQVLQHEASQLLEEYVPEEDISSVTEMLRHQKKDPPTS
ncbi:hypothetical protein CRUP_005306 [Coryphaenoides rupestris]|nr:hypothetical protein CRUP_005306 [Coryphaenoides rupestris]